MTSRSLIVATTIALLACPGCRGSSEPTTPSPTAAQPLPPLPPNPPVALLEFVPGQTSLALLVDVAALRRSSFGAPLIDAVRRLGETRAWEHMAGIDLSTDVDRLLFFGQHDPSSGASGDLADVMDRIRMQSVGVVFELSEQSAGADAECRRSDLDATRLSPVEGPMEHSHLARCGRFVVVSCCQSQPNRLAFNDAMAARALSRTEAAPAGSTEVASFVLGPDTLRRASCERSVIELTGWHRATAFLGDGLTVSGRIHAATPADAPLLEECIENEISEIANFNLLQQLGVGGLLSVVDVSQDPADAKDVIVTAPFDAQQTEFLVSLVELLGSGGLP